ncbi:MAG TPA: outer membrane protein assembly factor BamA [Thermoanaerobaculia bacterium]|nr:outer membrane protein assembly factor BamA [Thermoanaerobaculia bacterium]
MVDVDTARYGGGTIGAHYVLPQFNEPYPQAVELRYNGVSLEKLFNDWGITDTGLRGGATGKLTYRWNKDKVLDGEGSGSATLAKNAQAFSNAKYPMPLAGSADFALDHGTVKFKNAFLTTDKTRIDFDGLLRIEDVYTDFALKIHSGDFGELDRIGYNFAHSAGKKTYTLLGLGGAGDINATIKGKIKTPDVVAHITGTQLAFNDTILGNGDIDLKYEGNKNLLTFDRAQFSVAPPTSAAERAEAPSSRRRHTIAFTGTVEFPEKGPMKFDIAADAVDYPVDRAIKAVTLKLAIGGIGTGRLIVTGTPESGVAKFVNLIVHQGTSEMRLNGDVRWSPGKGNIAFNLDIGARAFPVADIAKFLDLGTLPVTGDVTGTLHLEGPKSSLEGAGAVTVHNGSIMGEPVTTASADIAFTKGTLKATNVSVVAPAGTIAGNAELNLNTNQFTYEITSQNIDLSKLKILASLSSLLGGHITLTSRGGGTFDQPELMVQATLNEATIKGLSLPPDTPPPTIYISIHNGRLTIKGSIADVLTIDGDGTIGADFAVDGTVRVVVTDIAKLVSFFPQTQSLPAAGNITIEAKLGGKLSAIETLLVDATIPQLNLTFADHEFTTPQVPHIVLQNGVLRVESFELHHDVSSFAVTGTAEFIGAKRLAINLNGSIEAALLQLLVPGLRADGHIGINGALAGTLSDPRITGSAELQDAQFRFSGFPQVLDHVDGRLAFRGDRIDIEQLRATLGGGTILAGGFVTIEGLTPKNVRLTIQGTDVAIRYFQGLTVEGNFNLLVSGGVDRVVVQGDVAVNRALYFKDFDINQALVNVLLSRSRVTPIVAASWQDRVDLRLHLTAPNTLAVRNNIADVTGSADIDVNGTLANPVVLGLVTLNEGGLIRFQKIDYRLVRGTINFQNPFRIDPYFDITVEGRISGTLSEVESGPVDVTVNLTGTIDRMTPTITSDPPASDITLFSLLGFGGFGTSKNNNAATSPGALTQGGSLLASSLSGLIGSKILPFADSFTIDPGLLDTTSGSGTKVTIEKRISNDIRFLVVYNLNDHLSREVVEWAVNPEWTLQFTRDEPRKEWRSEARFRRRYEGHWTFGSHGKTPFEEFSFGVSNSVSGVVATGARPSRPQSAGVPPGDNSGTPVQQVSFNADGHFDTSLLNQYISIKPGQPLSIRDVQDSIKTLFSTGNFRDVRVDETPSGNGVNVTFNLSLNYRVGKIAFEGLKAADKIRAGKELTIREGDVLTLNAVDHSAIAIQEMLTRSGYLEATVDPATDYFRDRNMAEVKMYVTPGPRATIGHVTFEGSTAPFDPAVVAAQMKRGPGKTFVINDARADADRMERWLVRRDYRKADIKFLGDNYDKATHTVNLRYSASVGPKVRVEVTGVPHRDVRTLIPFRRNQEYSEDAIERAADDIVKAYQQLGYYNATVDTEGKLEGDTWVSTFNVHPGQRYTLTAVTFTGNEKVPAKTLGPLVTSTAHGGFSNFVAKLFHRPTAPTSADLSGDRDAIESYYRLNGFSDAKVATPVVNAKADGTMTVDFPIAEGPQTIVTDIHIEGLEKVPANQLPNMLLRPGEPLNPANERADIVSLQTFYGERGYAEIQVSPRVEISPDKTQAHVTYVVAEGPKISVGDVVVRGNTYTKPSVVLRKSELDKGDPFSYTNIFEAQRNLYRLGIFNRVDVQPEQAGTSVASRNVVISVEEGKDVTVSGSLGITKQSGAKISPRVGASVAHRNLFGSGRYLGLEIVRARNDREVFLTYREPFIFNFNIPVQLTVFQTNDSTREETNIRQRGTFIEASKVSRYQTRWSMRYEYKISDCFKGQVCKDAENALIPGLDRSLLNIKISSISPTFFWDRRDDAIDPHHGFFTSASTEYAFRALDADANFLKEFVQGAWYVGFTPRTTLVLSGRAGQIQVFGNTQVPLSERFTAGGDTSHRAFPLDLLGTTCQDPRDDPQTCQQTLALVGTNKDVVAPIGGNGLLLMNAEYRFPIFASVNGAVFTDLGNVYHQAIRFNDLRYGVGTGIRYLSPVGPIRFDVGYNLHRRILRFDSDGNAVRERALSYFLTLGYAF